MMDKHLKQILDDFLNRIGGETKRTIKAIEEYLGQSEQQFNDQLSQTFVGKANKRIALEFDQFVTFIQYENYLLGNDDDQGESSALDQQNRSVSFGESSIKQEMDIDSKVKTEIIEEELNGMENGDSFTVWDPLASFEAEQSTSTEAVGSVQLVNGFANLNDSQSGTQTDKFGKTPANSCEPKAKKINAKVHDNLANENVAGCKKVRTVKKPTRGHKCDHCNYITSHKSDLTQHLRTHTGEKPFECEVCFKGFAQNVSLKKHMRTHANEFPFKCLICHIGFSIEHEWKTHESKCKHKRFECDLCEYVTLNKTNIVRHLHIHSGQLPFGCEICAKRFTQKQHLKDYMRIHANQFPFHCSKCRQGFSHRNQWKLHEINCNQRRFECYLCEYKTLQKCNLTDHMRLHSGVKPFQCSQCRKRFVNKSNLNCHIKIIHFKLN